MNEMSLEAFKTRVLPVKDKLYRLAWRLMKNEDEAKDIVQEVLLKMWERRSEWEKYRNMEAWCMRVTRNLAIDRLKSRQYKHTHAFPAGFDAREQNMNPHQKSELIDIMNRIKKFISDLPEKQKLVIQLRDMEGFTYKEIGEILDIDINQVKVNLFRARQAVKENLLNINTYGL